MAKRRKGRRRSNRGPSNGRWGARDDEETPREGEVPFDRRRIERHSAWSNRLLRTREWGTREEANAIVQEWIDAGSPEPDVEVTAIERAQDVMYDAFDEREGRFRGVLETRPYMRARAGLAGALWSPGDGDGAIAEYRGLLDLNPNDNQGIRILLSSLLAEEGRDEELEALLDEYEGEGSCNWPYSRALLAFRREGPTDRANDLLDGAVEVNPFVPLFVLGPLPLPDPPPYVSLGGPDEAVGYAVDIALAWGRTEGAAEWMAQRSLPLDELLPEDL